LSKHGSSWAGFKGGLDAFAVAVEDVAVAAQLVPTDRRIDFAQEEPLKQ